MDKLCVFCNHFYLDMGEPSYSELTPGSHATIGCRKDKWEMGNYGGTEEYRANIIAAVNCDEYEKFTPS